MKSKSGDVANKTVAMVEAAREVTSIVPRALQDMPELVHPGAKEIAVLTVVARQQAFEFAPVMKALEALAGLKDWSHNFLVAHELKSERSFGITFDWRAAPTRQYKSFGDFYQRELEPTWGNWENLQRTYARVVRGEITEEEGRAIILNPREIGIRGGKAGPGRGHKTGDNITRLMRGTSRDYILARLDRDGETELAEKVRAKEMPAIAAARELGWEGFQKQTPFEQIQKRIAKLSKSERRKIWEMLSEEFK
jgi:hypothetical protein